MNFVSRDLVARFCVAFMVLAALAFVGADRAVAQTNVCPQSGSNTCDQGKAFAECMSMAVVENSGWTWANKRCIHENVTSVWAAYTCLVDRVRASDGAVNANAGCAPDNVRWYMRANTCASRAPLAEGWFSTGSGPICKDGCAYGGESAPNTITLTMFPNSPAARAFRKEQGGFSPTGDTCSSQSDSPAPLTQEQCSSVGTLTQCMLPDGRHCAQASSGKKFCWQPNETGTKVSSNDAATKSPEGKPNNPPPIPPANNGNWEQTGSGSTTINNSGSTTTYNNNTYQSSSGGTGDGGGATNPDGSEEPGGDGEGDDEGDDPNTVAGGSTCVEGGAPTCSGASCTAEAFAILIQQWRARCADEEARGQFDSDATSGAGDAAGDDHGGMLSTLWSAEAESPSIDQNKVSIGGGLVIPTVTIFEKTWTAPPEFYEALGIIKFIVIASFTVAGLYVLWNR